MKQFYIKIAENWLKEHYSDKNEPIDIRWSAVINFAIWLDQLQDHQTEERK